jgi:hypothetical protein
VVIDRQEQHTDADDERRPEYDRRPLKGPLDQLQPLAKPIGAGKLEGLPPTTARQATNGLRAGVHV